MTTTAAAPSRSLHRSERPCTGHHTRNAKCRRGHLARAHCPRCCVTAERGCARTFGYAPIASIARRPFAPDFQVCDSPMRNSAASRVDVLDRDDSVATVDRKHSARYGRTAVKASAPITTATTGRACRRGQAGMPGEHAHSHLKSSDRPAKSRHTECKALFHLEAREGVGRHPIIRDKIGSCFLRASAREVWPHNPLAYLQEAPILSCI